MYLCVCRRDWTLVVKSLMFRKSVTDGVNSQGTGVLPSPVDKKSKRFILLSGEHTPPCSTPHSES